MSQVQLPEKLHTLPDFKPAVGSVLRTRRLEQGVSLEDISRQTFIKQYYLEALENNDFPQLPAPVYTAGYIRQYAKVLGLDGNELVRQYQKESQIQQQVEIPLPSSPTSSATFQDEDSALLTPSAFTPVFSQVNGRMKIKQVNSPPVIPTGLEQTSGDKSMQNQTPSSQVPKLPVVASSDNRVVETIEGARKEALVMKHQAEQYADRVLNQLEQDIHQTLQVIRNGRSHLKQRLEAYQHKS